jgi:hypothetical protein
MSDNIKMHVTNEWINWIEEAIDKEHLRYYEYNQFSNIQQIDTGAFGKVYRANWKNFEHLALKSFNILNNITLKEIVCEVILKYVIPYIFDIFITFLLFIVIINIQFIKIRLNYNEK